MSGSHTWNLKSRSKARLRTSLQRNPWLLSSITPCFIPFFPRDHNLRLFSLPPQAECKHIMVDSLPDCSLLYFQYLPHHSVPLITEWGNAWITDITQSYYKIFNRDSSPLHVCAVSRDALSQGNHFSTGNHFSQKILLSPIPNHLFETLSYCCGPWSDPPIWWLMMVLLFLTLSSSVSLGLDTHHFVAALDMWHMKVILQPPQSSLPLHTHRRPTVYRAGLSISLL